MTAELGKTWRGDRNALTHAAVARAGRHTHTVQSQLLLKTIALISRSGVCVCNAISA